MTRNRNPHESVDCLSFNITVMFACSHQVWATASSTPSIRKPASDDMNSAFLVSQDVGTYVCIHQIHSTPLHANFESVRLPATSALLKSSNPVFRRKKEKSISVNRESISTVACAWEDRCAVGWRMAWWFQRAEIHCLPVEILGTRMKVTSCRLHLGKCHV